MPTALICNIFSMFIFVKLFRNSQKPVCFYYSAISLINIITIIFVTSLYYSRAIEKNLDLVSEMSCKLFRFTQRALYQCSSWLHVIITFDRILVVNNIDKWHQRLSQKKSMLIAIFLLTLILCALNSINFFHFIITENGKQVCTASLRIIFIRD
jgi:hypothetical protein